MMLAMKLRTPEGYCVDTFPEAVWSLHCLPETGQKMYSVLTWLVGKVVCGDLYPSFSLQITALRRERLFSSSPCSAFLVVVLSGYACLV